MKFRSRILLVPALLPLLWSCEDETSTLEKPPIAVSFQATELVIAENSGSRVIALPLGKSVEEEGEIIINVSSLSDSFVLNPEATDNKLKLFIPKNQNEATFTITPKDNSIINTTSDELITFTISSVSEGLFIGNKESLKLVIADDEIPATANFVSATGRVYENSNDGIPVMIALSHVAPGEGSLTISLISNNGVYGTDFTTVPEAVDGKLDISIEAGVDKISFKLLPLNDNLFNGNRNISIKIDKAEGSISRGQAVTHDFVITDDELATKGKGYTTGAGLWTYQRQFTYNLDGTLAKVEWEQATPGTIKGTILYHYDDNGKLLKSIDNAVQETVYIWEGNRIVKSERIKNGVLVEYKLYGYDAAGNVGEVTQYNKPDGGNFVMSLMSVFLYHMDGNIYKQLIYNPNGDVENPILISTRTYENYLSVANPFTMVEILPNVKSQINLAGTYREEGNGSSFTYDLSYEFDSQGRPTKRISTSGTTSEVANYQYFD